jgi:hypothetical protein
MNVFERAILGAAINELVSDDPKKKPKLTKAETAYFLTHSLESYMVKHEFSVGDLVEFKPNLKNRKLEEDVAIVTKILSEPVMDPSADAGTNAFREPLNIIIGVHRDGTFNEFHVHSARLQPYTGPRSLAGEQAQQTSQ